MSTSAVDYDALAQQHGGKTAGTDYDALAAQHGGKSAGVEQSWLQKQVGNIVNPIIRSTVQPIADLAEGAYSGAASTLANLGDLTQRGQGFPATISLNPLIRRQMQAPESFMGQAGRIAEQVAEFAIPASLAGDAVKGGSLLTRMAAQSAVGGGVAAAQTGGQPIPTAAGIVGGAASEAIPAAIGGPSGISSWLKGSAAKEYGQALAATTKGNKYLSQNEVVPGLLDRGVAAFTQKGLLSKSNAHVVELGQAIGDAWDALPPTASIPVESIYDNLDHAAQRLFTAPDAAGNPKAMGEVAEQGIKHLQRIADTIAQYATPNPDTGAMEISSTTAHRVRQFFDEIAAASGRYQGQSLADASLAEAHGLGADAIREEFSKEYPSIAAINKEYSFWKDVQKVASDTVLRREGQAKPLSQQIAGAGGMAAGALGGGLPGAVMGREAMSGLQAAMNSTGWKTVSANLKNQLANYIASGDRNAAEYVTTKVIKAAAAESSVKAVAGPAQPISEVQP